MCKSNKNKSFTNLVEVMMHFADENTCKESLAEMRWRKGQYVVDNCHTNTIEDFRLRLQRGITRIYHNVSKKHLDAYVGESKYRYNTKDLEYPDRFSNMLTLCSGRITYQKLIN